MITIVPGTDSVDLSLTVPMFTSSETFFLTLSLITPAGDTAFQAGPTTVTPSATSGKAPAIPLTVVYTGVGSHAKSVRILTDTARVFFGDTVTLAAEALDSNGVAIPGTPIAWASLDTLRARVPNVAQGRVLGVSQRGRARITATLLTGPADTTGVLVQPVPARAAVEAGNNQAAQVATLLSQPVRFRVKAADSLGVSGVMVKFSVLSGGGSLNLDSAETNDSGRVEVQWTLGPTSGAQSIRARIRAAFADSVVTANAKALAGPPDSLAVNAGDAQTAVAGTALATAPSVVVRDSLGNLVPGATVTFQVTGGGGSVTGATPKTDSTGVARAGGWTLGTVTGWNTLRAWVVGPAGDTLIVTFSATANPAGAAAIQLTGFADTLAAGTAWPLTLTVRDGYGNRATGYTGTVKFTATDSLATLPAPYTFIPADSGQHTFAGELSLKVAGSRSVTATDSANGSVTGNRTVMVLPGSAASLAVTGITNPITAGLTTDVTVTAKDAFGNVATGYLGTVHFTSSDSLAVLPGNYTFTSGDKGAHTFSGAVTFLMGGSQAVTATDTATSSITGSLTVVVTAGAAARLVFTTQPPNTTAGATMTPVEVTAKDGSGNVATGFTGVVTLAFQSNPAGGTLAGTLSVSAVAGVATFNDLSVNTVGSGYTIQATAAGPSSTASQPFLITPVGMTHLWVGGTSTDWTLSTNWQGGSAPSLATDNVFVPASAGNQPTVGANRTVGAVVVENGATLTIASGITLTAGGNVSAGNTIVGPGTIQLTGYGATFQGALPNVVISDSVSLSGAATATGNVTVTVAAGTGKLNLNGQPFTITGNLDVINGATQVIMQQAGDQLAVAGNVTFNGGSENGLLTNGVFAAAGNLTQQSTYSTTSFAASGNHRTRLNGSGKQTVTFANTSFSQLATLELARSDTVALAAPLKAVGALIAPDSTRTVVLGGGASLDVAGLDADSLVLDNVLLTSAGGTLTRFDNVTFQNYAVTATPFTLRHAGAATPFTFNGLRFLTTPTTGKYLSVTDTLNNPGDTLKIVLAASQPVNGSALTAVSGGAVVIWSQLAFKVQPSATVTGQIITPAIQVEARDASGNPDPGFTGVVTIAIAANPGGGTLSGTLSQTAVAGVATFSDLSIDNIATGYTLSASASGYPSITSSAFDITAPALGIHWVNSAGGSWGTTANWNLNRVPTSSDTVFIQQNGTYTVTLDVDATVAKLTVGGSTGTQTLSVPTGRTLTLNGPDTVLTNGALLVGGTVNGPGAVTNLGTVTLTAGTLNPALDNQGLVNASGSTAINGALTTANGSTLRVGQVDGTTSLASLTVANGFTNNGAIELTTTFAAAYSSALTVTAGTLTNAGAGTISSLAGTVGGGSRTLTAQLDNQGTITVGVPLTINGASADHLNSGTINVSGGNLTLTQSGTTPTFTNTGTGTITIGTGRLWTISGGSFTHQTLGVLSGGGGLTLNSVTAAFDTTLTLSAVSVTNSTLGFAKNQSTATTAFTLNNVTLNGPGVFTNAAGQTVTMAAGTINANLVNDGTFIASGSTAINGSLTTASGSTLRVGQVDGTTSLANLTVANGFTNNGAIELTTTFAAAYSAALTVTSGTLTNASGGTISSLAGAVAGGSRTLTAQLDNQPGGTVTVSVALTINKSAATHTNGGLIDVSGGDLTVSSATSFTNVGAGPGTVTVGAGRSWTITGGTFTNQTLAVLNGGGALTLNSVTAAFDTAFTLGALSAANSTLGFATNQSTAAVSFTLTNTTVNGPGILTNDVGHTLTMAAGTMNANLANQGTFIASGSVALNGALTTAAGSTLRVGQVDGTTSLANLTVANGFTNNGAIELTTTFAAAYSAALTVTTGTLTNASGGTISSLAGTVGGGARTLAAQLNNQGTVTVSVPLTLNKASAADTNSGTINVSGGDLTLTQSGTAPSFTNTGVIDIASGRTLAVSGGTLTNADTPAIGTIRGAGTLHVSTAAFTSNGNMLPGGALAAGILGNTGGYTQAGANGTLAIELGGTTAGTQYDRLAVSGTATLGGTLNVALINSFVPAAGDTFAVLTYGARSGNFAAVNLPSVLGLNFDTLFVTDTLKIVVISVPLGTQTIWNGGVSTDWFTPTNWSGGVPDGATNVYIQAGRTFSPTISTLNASTANLILQPGAALTVASGDTLTVVGDLDGAYTTLSGPGVVVLTGAGKTLKGSTPTTLVKGSYAASDSVKVSGDLIVRGIGSNLDLGGKRVKVTGAFGTDSSAMLMMTNSGDTLDVAGGITFAGGNDSLLTAGVILARGDFTQIGFTTLSGCNVIGDSVETFKAKGTHRVVLAGSARQHVNFGTPGPALEPSGLLSECSSYAGGSQFGDLEVNNPAGVVFMNGSALVAGNLTVVNGSIDSTARISVAGNVSTPADLTASTLEVGGTLTFGAGAYSVGTSTFLGPVAAVPSALPYQTLRLVGSGTTTWSGALNTTGALVVGGTVHLQLGGPSTVSDAIVQGNGLLTLGGHKLSMPTTFGSFQTRGNGAFQMTNTADTLEIGGSAYFQGGSTDTLLSAGTILLSGYLYQYFGTDPRSFRPSGANRLVLNGSGAAQGVYFAAPGDPIGASIYAFGDSRFRTLEVTNPFGFFLASDVYVTDSLTMSGGGHISDNAPGHLLRVLDLKADSITVDTLEVAGTVAVPGPYGVTNTIFSGTGQTIPSLAYSGVTVSGTASYATALTVGNLTVSGNGVLTAAPYPLNVSGTLTTSNNGTLVMTDATAALTVAGNATFDGGASNQLTAGILTVKGNFQQLGTNSAASFAPSGSHKVVLNGASQTVSFANPDSLASHFQNLDVFGQGTTKTLASDAYLTGKLRADSTTTITGPYVLTVDDSIIIGFAFFGATITPAKVRVGGKLAIGGPINSFMPDTTEFFRLADTIAVNPSIAYKNVRVTAPGPVRFAGADSLAGWLAVSGSGLLSIDTNTVTVAGDLRTEDTGVLRMLDSSGSVTVDSNAIFAGGSTKGLLTKGTLRVKGNFTQGGDPAAFSADSGLTTHFVGAAAQSIAFANPDTSASHFGGLRVAQPAGAAPAPRVTLNSPAVAVGAFQIPGDSGLGQQKVIGPGKTLTVGGLNVNNLRLSGVLFAWKDVGAFSHSYFTRAGNITFDSSYATSDVQFYVYHSDPAVPTTFSMFGFVWKTQADSMSGGRYLKAEEYGGGLNQLILDLGLLFTNYVSLPVAQFDCATANKGFEAVTGTPGAQVLYTCS